MYTPIFFIEHFAQLLLHNQKLEKKEKKTFRAKKKRRKKKVTGETKREHFLCC